MILFWFKISKVSISNQFNNAVKTSIQTECPTTNRKSKSTSITSTSSPSPWKSSSPAKCSSSSIAPTSLLKSPYPLTTSSSSINKSLSRRTPTNSTSNSSSISPPTKAPSTSEVSSNYSTINSWIQKAKDSMFLSSSVLTMTLSANSESTKSVLPESWPNLRFEVNLSEVNTILNSKQKVKWINNKNRWVPEERNHSFISPFQTITIEKTNGTAKAEKCPNCHTFRNEDHHQKSTKERKATCSTIRFLSREELPTNLIFLRRKSTRKATRSSNKSTKKRQS